MPDTISKFITASDNATEYSDAQVDALEQARIEDIDNLMNATDDRDDELWDGLGVDETLIVKDYEEDEDRDIEWILGLAGIAAASQTQFFLDNREDTLIRPLAYREQLMSGFQLDAASLSTAGKRGVEYVSDTAFKELQAKWLDDMAFMRDMSNKELFDALREANALRPFDQALADSMEYVSRMTEYKPNSPQWKAAVNDLIEKDSKRSIKEMNRRSVDRIYTDRQIDGDRTTLMAWIVEGGPNTCSACASHAGEIRTYDEWEEIGFGPAVCYGGGYCRCHREAVAQ